ncbi:MAG: hypothetical protein A2289_23485 [Deltaproteobacteria bacterium RIFOXYA12_FULL_58_15]|nr:MAG: hypothetical protein A2289_23485 [Deltaproteobacteria bacterium RIFOXYA12_FULL_58_15]OGR14683.1 MAG: hypothetical protein A2341_06545 [Deltaproteobacteria bacterium RIFOXYB12_FULL_58_9]
MTSSAASHGSGNTTGAGVLFGLGAFAWWGFVPIYFKAVSHVSPLEVLAHRGLWSLLLLGMFLWWRGGVSTLFAPMRVKKRAFALAAATVLIATNWGIYIWAISHDRVIESSLGYFLNPLFNVLLAVVLLGERLRRLQKLSVALAAVGVIWHLIALGELPVISLGLAVSFSLYGIIHKKIGVAGSSALFVEVALLAPFAILYLVYAKINGHLAFANVSRATDLLLCLAGIVTALPLIWFIEATRRLSYVSLGFLQYVSPSLQLLLGTMLYGEPFALHLVVTFVFIWAGLAVFSFDSLRVLRGGKQKLEA